MEKKSEWLYLVFIINKRKEQKQENEQMLVKHVREKTAYMMTYDWRLNSAAQESRAREWAEEDTLDYLLPLSTTVQISEHNPLLTSK